MPPPLTDLSALSDRLEASSAAVPSLRLVTACDAFVDEMVRVVRERTSLDAFTPVGSIPEFAAQLAAAAGASSLREIVISSTEAGGCAVNLADGAASLGISVDLFATLGQPPHPAFSRICSLAASATPWGTAPGRTLAFEFGDGKLMFSEMGAISAFTPGVLAAALADGRFTAACASASAIALTNWSLFPHQTACWSLIRDHVLARLPRRPILFLDLVDPAGRSPGDISRLLQLIRSLEAHADTVLGLNGNEANRLASIAGLPQAREESDAVTAQAAALRSHLGISEVVIHRLRFAASATALAATSAPGPFTDSPRRSTGAGDRFNAGWLLGRLLGWEPAGRLSLGGAASGFFVRNARSASLADLVSFLRHGPHGDSP